MQIRHALIASATALALASVTAPVADAATTGPVLSGTGWKALTSKNIDSIDPGRQYTVTFKSAFLKRKYAPMLVKSVEQLQDMGVRIDIGGVTAVDATSCPSAGTIQFDEVYRPLNGEPGMSRALSCHDQGNNSAWGGHVQMDSEYWTGWNIPSHVLENTFAHELTHVLGLDHPNTDLNNDGKVEKFECVKTSYGYTPVMCSPNGGYTSGTLPGTLGYYDGKGIAQMLANFSL